MGDQRVFADLLIGLASAWRRWGRAPSWAARWCRRSLWKCRPAWPRRCARRRSGSRGSARRASPRPSAGAAGQRRSVERRLLLEELLAAEQLEIGVLDPALAQRPVGEVVHMLEDRQPRHQPRRQRRMTSLIRMDRAQPRFEKRPVDRPRRAWPADGPCRRSGRGGRGLLAAVSTLLRPHTPIALATRESCPSGRKITAANTDQTGKVGYLQTAAKPLYPGLSGFFHGRLNSSDGDNPYRRVVAETGRDFVEFEAIRRFSSSVQCRCAPVAITSSRETFGIGGVFAEPLSLAWRVRDHRHSQRGRQVCSRQVEVAKLTADCSHSHFNCRFQPTAWWGSM